MCVRVGVYVFVCVCKGSSFCGDILLVYLKIRINDLVLRILCWVLLPNCFISVSKNVISNLQRRKLQQAITEEKTIGYIGCEKIRRLL